MGKRASRYPGGTKGREGLTRPSPDFRELAAQTQDGGSESRKGETVLGLNRGRWDRGIQTLGVEERQ